MNDESVELRFGPFLSSAAAAFAAISYLTFCG